MSTDINVRCKLRSPGSENHYSENVIRLPHNAPAQVLKVHLGQVYDIPAASVVVYQPDTNKPLNDDDQITGTELYWTFNSEEPKNWLAKKERNVSLIYHVIESLLQDMNTALYGLFDVFVQYAWTQSRLRLYHPTIEREENREDILKALWRVINHESLPGQEYKYVRVTSKINPCEKLVSSPEQYYKVAYSLNERHEDKYVHWKPIDSRGFAIVVSDADIKPLVLGSDFQLVENGLLNKLQTLENDIASIKVNAQQLKKNTELIDKMIGKLTFDTSNRGMDTYEFLHSPLQEADLTTFKNSAAAKGDSLTIDSLENSLVTSRTELQKTIGLLTTLQAQRDLVVTQLSQLDTRMKLWIFRDRLRRTLFEVSESDLFKDFLGPKLGTPKITHSPTTPRHRTPKFNLASSVPYEGLTPSKLLNEDRPLLELDQFWDEKKEFRWQTGRQEPFDAPWSVGDRKYFGWTEAEGAYCLLLFDPDSQAVTRKINGKDVLTKPAVIVCKIESSERERDALRDEWLQSALYFEQKMTENRKLRLLRVWKAYAYVH
jgi:hypothetical protein